MPVTLLRTKLYIPQPRPGLVARPRLVRKLSDGFARKLTLVSAPPGFGKSTALSEWAAATDHPVAWLSLDAGDNDFARFWAYAVSALATVLPPLGNGSGNGTASPPEPAHHQAALIHLINTIAESATDRFSLVLDDFHLITEPSISDALLFLVEALPPQMHMLLAGRADPPWPLARLRARGELSEIRADDLRFTAAEAAAFLNDVMGLALSPEEIDALEERTEGWIAGLQMAALSMRGRDDVSGFIQSLSGSHRFIMDYLVEEVLERQPPAVRTFLLETSILDRLSAPLCDSVTGGTQSQAMLADLEQRNLFLMPQDDTRRWYRYHHLFGDLLQSRLLALEAGRIAELHRRASDWYERNDLLAEAMHHAQAAGDTQIQVRLIAQNVLTMAYYGELTTLVEWLDALPADLGRNEPWFCVSRAWVMVFAGHVDTVETHVQAAERTLEQADLSIAAGERAQITGHIAAIRAYVIALRGDFERGDAFIEQALALLPATDPARGWTTLLLAISLRTKGDFAAAEEMFTAAANLARSTGVMPLLVDVLWEHSQSLLWQGRLHASLRMCEEVLKLTTAHFARSGHQLPPTGYTYSGIAAVQLAWNDLDTALENAEEAVRLSKRWGMADALVRTHQLLAEVLNARGDPAAAQEELHAARQTAEGISAIYVEGVVATTARLQLLRGQTAAAAQWVADKGLHAGDLFGLTEQGAYLILARLRLAQATHQGSAVLEEALVALERVIALAAEAGTLGALLEALVLKALALRQRGDETGALAALRRALALGEAEGFARVFVREGAPMAALLERVRQDGAAGAYVDRLLAAIPPGAPPEQSTPRAASGFPSLAEPLTDRELDVLRLLRSELSSTEIADTLVVAPSTVRTHVKSIYGKLDVHDRRAAVDRAVELGLV